MFDSSGSCVLFVSQKSVSSELQHPAVLGMSELAFVIVLQKSGSVQGLCASCGVSQAWALGWNCR